MSKTRLTENIQMYEYTCKGCGNSLSIEIDFRANVKVKCKNKSCKFYNNKIQIKSKEEVKEGKKINLIKKKGS